MSIQDLISNLINNNPNIQNNPQAKEYLDVIQHNDSARGQQIAENLCKTYGVSTEEAVNRAKQFFGIR